MVIGGRAGTIVSAMNAVRDNKGPDDALRDNASPDFQAPFSPTQPRFSKAAPACVIRLCYRRGKTRSLRNMK